MPIRPEQVDQYPPNWLAIREAILERAGNRCEGSPRWPDCRARNHEPHPVTDSTVVLTIAHLDHQAANCQPSNLKAMCQRCHLVYDAKHHAQTRYLQRQAAAKTDDIFNGDIDLLAIRDGRAKL